MSRFNHERAASALVDALFTTDERAAKKWGVAKRTIRNWRSRLNDDQKLALLFQDKKNEVEKEWAGDIPPAIRGALKWIEKATNPHSGLEVTGENLHYVTGAFKILSEVDMMSKVIASRMAEFSKLREIPAKSNDEDMDLEVIDAEFAD